MSITIERCLLLLISSVLTNVHCNNIALLIIDVQNCFLPNGSLAVQDGEQVIPVINNIRTKFKDRFSLVALSQDWHCVDHVSFASQHAGKIPFEYIQLQYDDNGNLCDNETVCNNVEYNVTQRLWPDHCVINTTSAEFSLQLSQEPNDVIIRKGYNCKVDSYSAFYDNGKFDHTELNQILKSRGIDTVFVLGLATDYCVYFTSVDAKELGYLTYMVEDATRGVAPETTADALADMRRKGVNVIQSNEVGGIIDKLTSGVNSLTAISYHMILTILAVTWFLTL